MAFFDELGKKISNAGLDAIEKTKNATNAAKINSSISDENRIINNCYKIIGELFCQCFDHSDIPEIQHQLDLVARSKQNIASFQMQLLEIKGVTICPVCKKEITVGSAFCSNCGYKMPVIQNEQVQNSDAFKCPECGMTTKKELNFCINCGAKLHKDDVVVADNEPI